MTKRITAEELDALVDEGADITGFIDMASVCQPGREEETRRVNVDYPLWVIDGLDSEASRIGVSRQALIKLWTVERLDAEAAKRRVLA